ncbi:hypothetical protein [Nostoc phage A1]|nr:hypothetical protein [Nostoc phage A1]
MIDKYLYYSTGSIKKINPDWVVEQLANEGYTMLSTYESINKPFKFICPNGHKNKITLNNWNQSKRCSMCSHNNVYRNDGAKSFFEKFGYTIIEGEYKNNRSPMKYVCSKGHINTVTLSALKHYNSTCPYCKGTRTSIEDVRKFLSDRGCELLRPLIDFKQEYKVVYKNAKGEIKEKYWRTIKTTKKL